MADVDAHPFGEPEPGSAVHVPDFDPCAGYTPHGDKKFARRGDGKWVRVDHIQREKEQPVTTAIAERQPAQMATWPKQQIDLVRRTVAVGATDDELALYLYDCERRGIHPLDKLLHFTKRGGKYTPVTSIDFMRAQAAMSGEMAGSDDPRFDGTPEKPLAATVTVYRITQGQRYAYQATARWSEYCPDNAPMWRRMPHTMLGKCAEALALRKAFPQQLAGLYSSEEMDQAPSERAPSDGKQIERAHIAPSVPNGGGSGTTSASAPSTTASATTPGGVTNRVVPNGEDSGRSDNGPDLGTAEIKLPDGFRLIDDYKLDGEWHHITWGRDAQGGWMIYKTKLAKIGLEAHNAFTEHMPVRLHAKKLPYLDKVEKLGVTLPQIEKSAFTHDDPDFCAGCGKPFSVCDCDTTVPF